MHKIHFAPVVGSPFETGWSTTLTSANQRIVCAIAVKGSGAKNAGLELAELISNQSQTTAQSIHNLLLDLLKKARELEVVPQLALVAFSEKIAKTGKPAVILATYQGQILLKRAQKNGCVIQFANEPKIIEGSVKEGDEFVLATAQTEQLEQSIRQLFKNNLSPDAFASNLNQKVQMLIDSSLFSVAMLRVQELDLKFLSPSPILASLEETVEKGDEVEPEVKEKIENVTEKIVELKNYSDYSKTVAKPEQKENIVATSPQKNEPFSPPQEAHSYVVEPKPSPQIEDNTDIKIKIGFDPIIQFAKKTSAGIYNFAKKAMCSTKKKLFFWYENYKKNQRNKTIISKPHDNDQKSIELINSIDSRTQTVTSTSTMTHATRWAKLSKNLFALFKHISLPNLVSSKDIYLGKKDSKIVKKLMIVTTALITVGLIIVLGKGLINRQQTQAREALQPAIELLEQAKQQTDNNILEARDQVAQAIELAIAAQKELGSNRFIKIEFDKFIENAHEYYTQIDGQIEVSQLDIFFDIREIIPNFLTTLVTSNAQVLFFLDQEQKQLVSVNKNSKQVNKIIIDSETNVKDFSASENKLFILDNGIFSLDLAQDLTGDENGVIGAISFGELKKIKDEGDSDRDGVFIEFYENYLYIFNPDKRNIYRYIVRQDDLSDPIGWLINKQGIEFSNITSLAVDGFIWLTTNDGKILKLERGQPVEFEIAGLEDPLGTSIIISTNKQTEYLYLLEPTKNRLVVLSKSGEFIRQISSPTFASTTQLLVHEEDKKAYVVSGSIVYVVEL